MRMITAFICGCLGSVAVAATPDLDNNIQNPARQQGSGSTKPLQRATSSEQVLFRAEPLIGRTVQTENAQELGELTEIVFHPEVGIFGVVSGEDDRLIPVPWKYVMAVTQNAVVVDIDAQKFQQAPSFADGEWATFNSPQFTRQVDSYFRQGGASMRPATGQYRSTEARRESAAVNTDTNVTFSSAVASVIDRAGEDRDEFASTNRVTAVGSGRPQQVLYRAEPLIGRTVNNALDQELGELSDIVFHPEVGIYAVIEAEDGRFVPVPWTMVSAVTPDSIIMNVTPRVFNSAPIVKNEDWASFNSPRFTESVDVHFKRAVGGSDSAGLQGTDTGVGSQSETNRPSGTWTNRPAGATDSTNTTIHSRTNQSNETGDSASEDPEEAR